jgi:hypothetical protein
MRSRVELFESIRRDSRVAGMGIRALARKHHVHRRTVRQALLSAVPPQRKPVERPSPVLEAWKPLIRAWVTADEALPKKQRHTGRRVWQRLVAEYGAEVGESTQVRRPAAPGVGRRRGLRDRSPGPPSGAGGRGRLRRVVGVAGGDPDQAVAVHHAPVVLGAGVPSGVCDPGAGGVLRGARAGLRPLRWRALPGAL